MAASRSLEAANQATEGSWSLSRNKDLNGVYGQKNHGHTDSSSAFISAWIGTGDVL
jgi:hypothetical protein